MKLNAALCCPPGCNLQWDSEAVLRLLPPPSPLSLHFREDRAEALLTCMRGKHEISSPAEISDSVVEHERGGYHTGVSLYLNPQIVPYHGCPSGVISGLFFLNSFN